MENAKSPCFNPHKILSNSFLPLIENFLLLATGRCRCRGRAQSRRSCTWPGWRLWRAICRPRCWYAAITRPCSPSTRSIRARGSHRQTTYFIITIIITPLQHPYSTFALLSLLGIITLLLLLLTPSSSFVTLQRGI